MAAIWKIPQPWAEPEAQQRAEREDVVGRAAGVGVVCRIERALFTLEWLESKAPRRAEMAGSPLAVGGGLQMRCLYT